MAFTSSSSPVVAASVDSIAADLDLAMTAMEAQADIYQPTSFWADAARQLAEQIKAGGIDNFRRLPLPLAYFVPTYGVPGNRLAAESVATLRRVVESDPGQTLALDRLLSGREAALADFRVLTASDDKLVAPSLHTFSESDVGRPSEQFVFDDRRFSRSSLNYLLGLAFLKRHLGLDRLRTVLEIGGGFGTLGEILLSGNPHIRYIDLDIPPNSVVAQYYLSTVFGVEKVATFRRTLAKKILKVVDLPSISTLCNWQIENIDGEIDLFVNFISFQEMEPSVVSNYLQHVSRLAPRWILMRNMREGKQRRTETTVGVIEPIVSDDYPRMLLDYDLVDVNVLPYGEVKMDGYHSELMLLKRRVSR